MNSRKTSSLCIAGRGAGALAATLMASAAMPALAQTAPTPPAAAATPPTQAIQEIVVTGSRVIRNGYQAPTPLTVVTADAIQKNSATANIATYLEQMPAIAGSLTPQGNLNASQSGNTRVNALSLRNLGPSRTLLLVDGQRVVSSTINGAADLNTIPQQLVSRVDIVTGGASAVYGSDAVAGVVNVILDHKFTGIKLDVSGNVTSYGDNPGFDVQASGGHAFAGDRGHVIVSAEDTYQAGIFGDGGRKWNSKSQMLINNPAYAPGNGQPNQLTLSNVQLATQAAGGLVFSGPLQGLAFGPGGTPYQFQYGSVFNPAASPTANPYMVGGTPNQPREQVMSLENAERRFNLLSRVEYEVTPDITVFAQGSYAQSRLWSNNTINVFPGNTGTVGKLGGPPLIQIDNPFLPASVVAAMTAAHVTSIPVGTYNGDIGPMVATSFRQVNRITFGADGKYELFGKNWTWNATYLYNNSKQRTEATRDVNKVNYFQGIDAVINPATGAIVCRSTLTNPTNGCIPMNILGTGVATAAAINYVTGTSWGDVRQVQQVFDANTQGTLFNNWAGPVNLSADFAYRTEQGTAVSNEYAPGNTTVTQWAFVNQGFEDGKYSVTEGALETLFPLLKDLAVVRSWDLNAAVRFTDYSTSGNVMTWKIGSTLQTTADIRLRASLSHDIRAPNINELYSVGAHTTSALGFADPATGGNPTIQSVTGGNPNLKPEEALQQDMGFVWQPSFLPRFSFSADYWAIYMTKVIATLTNQNIVNLCYFNNTGCAQITRAANGQITTIANAPLNEANSATRGIDFEASYNFPLSDLHSSLPGRLTLHGNATEYLEAWVNSGVGTYQNNVGVLGQVSRWRATATANYDVGDWDVSLGARGFTGGVYASGAIQCSTGCPTSTANNTTYSIAGVRGMAYLDGSLTYTFRREGSQQWQAYVNVKNILDSDPPTTANTNTYYTADTNTGVFDYLGRVYRVGIRMKF